MSKNEQIQIALRQWSHLQSLVETMGAYIVKHFQYPDIDFQEDINNLILEIGKFSYAIEITLYGE